jgi:allophanate hydrolase subunit 2
LESIRPGDTLACSPSWTEPRSLPFGWGIPNDLVIELTPQSEGRGGLIHLRALPGPQRDWFADDAFFNQEYEVSTASNRMGLRLKGTPLSRRPGELVSEAVAPGAVQITNDGLPIVLGVDGQTIGGYPKLAHVIRADLDWLAQLRPGDRIRFVHVTREEAEDASRQRAAFLHDWLTRLRIAERQPVLLKGQTPVAG